jgi:hypothetical protein
VNEVRRPRGVTVVAILVWVEGLFYVAAGMVILVNLENPGMLDRVGGADLAIPAALASFGVALAFLGLSGGLLRGTSWSRVLVAVLLLVSLVLAVYVISGGVRIFAGILIAAVAVLALILLWTPRASVYFRGELRGIERLG